LAPRTVQWTAIFSLRRIPKDLTVYLALKNTRPGKKNKNGGIARKSIGDEEDEEKESRGEG